MAEPINPRALTYAEMMNGGRQQMDEAEHAREQQLNSGSKTCRRTLIEKSLKGGIESQSAIGG